MSADWLWFGLAALVLSVVVLAAAAGGGSKEKGERPLFGDETEEERDREQ
jgi:hypothetical protein